MQWLDVKNSFLFELSVVSGCFRLFLIMLGRKATAAKIGGVGVFFFFGRCGNAKAGGLFPRNGKEAVWKGETLEDMHGWFVLQGRLEWTFCCSRKGCLHVWLKPHTHTRPNPPSCPPSQPCCETAKWSRQVSPSWISF